MRRAFAALMLLAAPAQAHDFYSDLRAPDTGLGCCGGHDCAPREACRTADIPDGLIVDGVCYPIDPAKVLKIVPEDGRDHACRMKGDAVPRCFILTPRV